MTTSNHIIKRIFLYSVLFFSIGQCSYSWAGDPADEAAKEAAKSGLKVVSEKIAEGISYASVAWQIKEMVQEIKSHNFPTKEEEAEAEKIADEYGFLAARSGFAKCLAKNNGSSGTNAADLAVYNTVMAAGVPVACREIRDALIFYGGKKEADRLTAIYNECRK